VGLFLILQDRSVTNDLDSDHEEEQKTKIRFFWNKAKKNKYIHPATKEGTKKTNIFVPPLWNE
jgi:hypothetical protein